MRQLPPLKAVQAFEAAARLGSFGAAAEELHLTPSAISHQIRLLEGRLGLGLFHRVHRAVVLTDAGRRYAETVAQAFSLIESGTRAIERTDKSDILTVHSVPSVATQWLMPRLARFSTRYPDIDLRINASTDRIDLAASDADFDIRYGPLLPDTGVIVEPFPEEAIVVLCAPAPPLAASPEPRTPEALRGCTLVHSEINLSSWRDWLRDHPGAPVDLARGPRFDRSFMAIHAAADGLGVALESRLLLQRELDAGRIVLPFGNDGPRLVCHRLLWLRTKAHLPKMRAFRDWLFDELVEASLTMQAHPPLQGD